MGKILSIYICPDKGQPMQERQHVNAIAGVGLEGDRYAAGKGAWSKARATIRHVSLIAIEAIAEANNEIEVPFSPSETRRNLLTEGVNPNVLVGGYFMVGCVKMRGVELCDPCARPSNLAGKPGFEKAYQKRGGLRAEILTSGMISVGDEILLLQEKKPMDFILVRATEEDVDDYIRIGTLNTSRFNITSTDPKDVLEEIRESVVYMIEIDGVSIGLVSYVMRGSDHAYVSEVQVEPDFRGKGIGGQALAIVLQELESVGTVDLLTHPENPAQKLYGRHGFVKTGEVMENHHGTGEPRMRMLLVRG